MDKLDLVRGTIENVVYYNEDTDYAVIELSDKDNRLITAVGTLPIPVEGESITIKGKWTYHKEFGKQLTIESFEKNLPEGIEEILQYLSAHTVKGVGPTTAKKIVDRFGKDTFSVIENNPEWLTDINGITMKKAAAISESFREQNGLRGVVMFCKDYMSVGEATKVYKKLGSGAVGVIMENPYVLCESDYGIPFVKADELAKSIGFDEESDFRVFSGLKYILKYNSEFNGHTCLPYEKLALATADCLKLHPDMIKEKIADFIKDDKLCSFKSEDAEYVMTREVERAELFVAKRISAMDGAVVHFGMEDVAAMINSVERVNGITYATLQRKAIYAALANGVMILTGGPGTGKTTIVKALISIFSSLGLKTVLAAPTGRAAKRMSEATGAEAKTVHRMLEMERGSDSQIRFGRTSSNPLDENVVIVDEASMIDILLMEALMRAMRKGSRLILIGDSNQLPSVGAGNVLADLIESDRICRVELKEVFRQSEESLIVTNAHKINDGNMPYLASLDGDFFFIRRDSEASIPITIADLITKRLPKKYGSDVCDKIQVITPSRKGVGGVDSLNAELQKSINPESRSKNEKHAHGSVFRVGDKVMQTVNNYEIEWNKSGGCGYGIFNGDIGVIEEINTSESFMLINFDERYVKYAFADLDELELAYAITVHKSQGSEYPIVIIPAYTCPPMLMTRNLLYTAITRAKRMVIMVGRVDVVSKMVQNKREVMRYTTLKERIIRWN